MVKGHDDIFQNSGVVIRSGRQLRHIHFLRVGDDATFLATLNLLHPRSRTNIVLGRAQLNEFDARFRQLKEWEKQRQSTVSVEVQHGWCMNKRTTGISRTTTDDEKEGTIESTGFRTSPFKYSNENTLYFSPFFLLAFSRVFRKPAKKSARLSKYT